MIACDDPYEALDIAAALVDGFAARTAAAEAGQVLATAHAVAGVDLPSLALRGRAAR